MTECLVMFLPSVSDRDPEGSDYMLDYGMKNIHIIPYRFDKDSVKSISASFSKRGYAPNFIRTNGPMDKAIYDTIKGFVIASKNDTVKIDLTFASNYHSAIAMKFSGIEGIELYMSYWKNDTIVHERLDSKRYIYNGILPPAMAVMDVMDTEPMDTSVIIGKVNGKVSDSSVYKYLEELVACGLIERCEGEVPDDYKSRTKNFFRVNEQQKWDYFVYRRYYDRHNPRS